MSYNKKSESYNNIKKAFCDESAGHVRYMILSENAEKDGNHDLARLYKRLSEEELGHARIWYGEQGHHDCDSELKTSISEESAGAAHGYPKYASMAELEGYEGLADRFLANGRVEANHHELLMNYLNETKDKTRHNANEDCVWRCTLCDQRHIGTSAPERGPLCDDNRTAYLKEM